MTQIEKKITQKRKIYSSGIAIELIYDYDYDIRSVFGIIDRKNNL